jgi:hypothetical protein
MSKHIQIAMLALVLLSACASLAVGRFHSHSLGLSIGVPALVISGWAFFGHLITLDEDAPGSFFNPVSASSSRTWHSSLVELLAKAGLLAVVCALVFAGQ